MTIPTHAGEVASPGSINDSSSNITSQSSPTREFVAGTASDRLNSTTASSAVQPNLMKEWKEELDGAPATSSDVRRRNAELSIGVPLFVNNPADSEAPAKSGGFSAPNSFSASTTAAAQAAILAQAGSATLKSTPTLLGLPAELRNRIYDLAVQLPTYAGETILLGPSPAKCLDIDCDTLNQPPLALVNKELRADVLPMWRHIAIHEADYVTATVFDYDFDCILDYIRELKDEPQHSVSVSIVLSFPEDLSSTREDRRECLRDWFRGTQFRTLETLGISYYISTEDAKRSDLQYLREEVLEVGQEDGGWWGLEGEDIWMTIRDTMEES